MDPSVFIHGSTKLFQGAYLNGTKYLQLSQFTMPQYKVENVVKLCTNSLS